MTVDYETLTSAKTVAGSIKSMVNYDLIDPVAALTEAQAYIYGALRVREMRLVVDVTIAEGGAKAPLPDGLLDPLKLMGPYGEIAHVHEIDMLEGASGGDGDVAAYAIVNEEFYFDCASLEEFEAKFLFYGRPPDLAGTEQNFLTRRYAHILLAACRFYAYLQMEQSGEAGNWKKICDESIVRANVEADLSYRGIDYSLRVR